MAFLLTMILPFSIPALEINIISNKNGVGLSRDVDILSAELKKYGHKVVFVNDSEYHPRPKVDINIFVQPRDAYYFPYAEKNYLIPNPEYTFFPHDFIPKFDKILCKTREAERIFKALNPNTVFISFTCKDRYDPLVEKRYKAPFHLAGASSQKGTETVVKTWIDNEKLPLLILLRHKHNSSDPSRKNINLRYEYLEDSELSHLQNSCGLHICPSDTEGFGHYIFEAMSCGAVVVTTDAPPMNEFVTDKRCLAGYSRTGSQHYATTYYVDPTKLDHTVSSLLCLTDQELEEIGKKNRKFFLENDRFFKEKIAELFSNVTTRVKLN